MEETEKFFETTPVDRDATLATPRFDEGEAQVARPVVPLANSSVRSRRSQWPIALVLISALAGGAISIFAFRLYQQRQTQTAAATQSIEQPQEDTTSPPPQMPAPETPSVLAAGISEETAQPEVPTVIETFETERAHPVKKKDDKVARQSERDEAKAARKDSRQEGNREADEKRAERDGGPRQRRAEVSPAPRRIERTAEDGRRYDQADGDEDAELRRERRRQRREERRGPQRNIDRIKDIFQGPPPA